MPDKYQPTDENWRTKDWLREKYWGEMMTVGEIAEEVGVGRKTVTYYMDEYGIPRRTRGVRDTSHTSPFAGFYGDAPAQGGAQKIDAASNPPEQDDPEEFTWTNYMR